jgi:hypothetical protein
VRDVADDPRRFWRDKPLNWPLPPGAPCTPGWLSVQFLVIGRSAADIARELECETRGVEAMLSRLGVSEPGRPRGLVELHPRRPLMAVAA